MMRHRSKALAVFALGAAFLSTDGCARPQPGGAALSGGAGESELRPTRQQDGGAATALDTHTRGWQLGSSYAYRVKLGTMIDIGSGGHTFDFDVVGDLAVTPTAVTPESVTMYVQMANTAILSRAGNQADFDKVAAEMNHLGCLSTVTGGRFAEMGVPRGLASFAANAYREIASSLQFARAVRGTDRYEAEEYDSTGQYVAQYEVIGPEDLWSKRKDRYVAILSGKQAPGSAAPQIVPEVRMSKGRVRLSVDGRPLLVDSQDELAINGAEAPVHAVTTVSIESAPIQSVSQPKLDDSLLASMDRVGAGEPYGRPVSVEALDDARIRGLTFDRVVSRFEDLAGHEKDRVHGPVNGAQLDPAERAKGEEQTQERSRLFIALAAIFRKHPETVAEALKRLRAKSPASPVLIDALGSASSPEAQRALVELLNSQALDPKLRPQVMLALSRTPRPGQEAIDALKQTLAKDPFDAQALYGLGTYARRLRDAGATGGARELGEFILDRFKLVKGPSQLMTLLGAITNSGYTPALARVTPYLTDGQEPVRVAAVRALQSMQDPRVDEILATHVQSDSSSEVSISALEAAKVREPTDVLAQALAHAATRASDARVRYRAVEAMAVWMRRRADMRAALERVAQSDSEERVRNRAKAAL